MHVDAPPPDPGLPPQGTLFDALPIGAYRSRPDGSLVRANLAMARLNGFERLQDLYARVHDIGREWYVDPGRRDVFRARLEADGRVADFVSQVRRYADGCIVWVREHAHLVRSDGLHDAFYEGTVEDITEQVRDRADVGRNEQLLRQMAEHVPGMIYRVRFTPDPEDRGRFIFVNSGVRELYGVEPEAVLSDTRLLRSFCHPEDMERVDAEVDAAKHQAKPLNVAFRIVVDGQVKWVQMSSSMVTSADGEQHRVGVMIDVTAQRQAEALRQQRDRAEAQRRHATQFLSRVSHELRTPLNAILGLAQLIESEADTPELQRGWSRTLLASGQHLLALVDDVLDLTGAQSGQMQVLMQPVALGGALREAWALVDAEARARALPFGGVPAAADTLQVQADRRRLVQVLTNLLSNAVKYNRPGGMVSLRLRGDADPVELDVVDQGPGLTAEQLARLFQPFDRLGAQHGTVPGTGLGLALSRQLAEAMGGTLDASSTPGQGCCFTLRLRPAG
ncbi:MAG: ATP-binding protein [Rubrivivax sp.]